VVIPQVVCDDGFYYDSSSDACVPVVLPPTPAPTLTCDDGYTLDLESLTCV